MPPTWASAPQPPPDSLPRQRMSPPGKEAQGAANTEGKRGAMRSGSSEYHELVSPQPAPASYPVPVATPTSPPGPAPSRAHSPLARCAVTRVLASGAGRGCNLRSQCARDWGATTWGGGARGWVIRTFPRSCESMDEPAPPQYFALPGAGTPGRKGAVAAGPQGRGGAGRGGATRPA